MESAGPPTSPAPHQVPHKLMFPKPRRTIRVLLLLVALVNLAWSLYQLPVSRVVESRLCHDYYADNDPSSLLPDGTVPEDLCKVDAVQQRLGRIQGVMETIWVAGDFLMTVPLVSLADVRGPRFVLCLNLVSRVFLLAWTFMVGFFDQLLPVNAILLAPVLSLLGGDCVFNSIVYSIVSELTEDHVLRATYFGYVNAVSSIFSSQLGPALASATMSLVLWLPLWAGIALLLAIALPAISTLPAAAPAGSRTSGLDDIDDGAAAPLISGSAPPPPAKLRALAAKRLAVMRSILTNPSPNFVLLLCCFFLASLASSDTKLLPLYMSKRYGWRFVSIGYLLSGKALFNFVLLSFVIPRILRLRRSRVARRSDDGGPLQSRAEAAADQDNVSHAHVCLVFSVLGALAIGLSPTIWTLVPSLLLYALGIALPMFTYSLLKSPSMAIAGDGAGPGTQIFSVVMMIRTVGTLVGAMLMPTLWVGGMKMGGAALGMPYLASAAFYAVAALLVRRIKTGG